MLNIYISADIEGINNVVYPHQTDITGKESYYKAQKQLQLELNSVVSGLLEANVNLITINDSHGSMENLHISDFDNKVELITGKPKPVSMLSGLDSNYSCVFFIGYHAMAGSYNGVLAHTFSPLFRRVMINNEPIGEVELNSIYAGLLNVPVAFLSGDNIVCAQAVSEIGDIRTVITKTAISTTSARCRPNQELFEDLKSSAKEAVLDTQRWILYEKNPPYTIEIDFVDRKLADIAELMPGIRRVSDTTVSYTSNIYQEVYKLLQFLSATLSKY